MFSAPAPHLVAALCDPAHAGAALGEPERPGRADLAWAASGAMALTGEAAGPPLLAPAPLAGAAARALGCLTELAWQPERLDFDAAALLGERAACFGFARAGQSAAGARCRLLRAAQGWLAVHLARDDDVAALPAWLECEPEPFAWERLAARVARRDASALVARARLLGMPISPAAVPPRSDVPWCRIAARGTPRVRPPEVRPRVVDLTSLWAGPLCTHLMERAGGDVVKVESRSRPDGARRGDARFYALLNHGKRSVALDFSDENDRRALHRLLRGADIVVESSRPRALLQLGIDAERLVRECPGLTWVGITGHGRAAPQRDWIAFGDDAAAAGGLCQATGGAQRPLFCGDAVADPLTGLYAAVAGLAAHRAGGGVLVDLALADVISHLVARPAGSRVARVVSDVDGDFVEWAGDRVPVAPPRARAPDGAAAALGADTAKVLAAC
ncbi:MAG: CoA transferase [Deltaproteobacteria bacterium]|nr:CoA transferase [Deltaproteobacteria bacterium]MBW2360032.1 CoA transferase [Deltaproteobacteria bacterium]